MTSLAQQRLIAFGVLIVATSVAAVIAYFWGLSPVGFVSYMSSHAPTEREIIDFAWPRRIVSPAYFADTVDGTLRWTVAETAARFAVIAACWFAITVWVCREYRRHRRHQ
jgi:hypothetical protein